jgi:hypothetical protein
MALIFSETSALPLTAVGSSGGGSGPVGQAFLWFW